MKKELIIVLVVFLLTGFQQVFAAGGETCATATVISSLPFSDSDSTSGHTNDHDAGGSAPDVVYSYTPASNEWVTVSLCNSDFDTRLYVYEGASCDGTSWQDYNDDSHTCSATLRSHLEAVYLAAGSTYYIVVDGYSGYSGNYTLDVTSRSAPVNGDHCRTAFPISMNSQVTDNTCTFTDLANTNCDAFDGQAEDIWYTFDINSYCTGVEICLNADFDAVVQLNDDCYGVVECNHGETCTTSPACTYNTNSAHIGPLSLYPGTYYIIVDGYQTAGTDCGNFCLDLTGTCGQSTPTPTITPSPTETPIPVANDDCSSATVITSMPFTETVDTTNATASGPDVSCNTSSATELCHDIWYKYTPAQDCYLTVTTTNSPSYDSVTALFSGPDCGSLTEEECLDADYNGFSFDAVAGVTYWIRTGGYYTSCSGSNQTIHVTCLTETPTPTPTQTPTISPTPAVPYDHCDNALDISAQINAGTYPQTISGDAAGATNYYSLGSCGTGGNGGELVYVFTPDSDRELLLDLCGTGSHSDTVMYLRHNGPCPGTDEVECDDDGCPAADRMSMLSCHHFNAFETYYLFIDAYSSSTTLGTFTLTIDTCVIPTPTISPTPTDTPVPTSTPETTPGEDCANATIIASAPYYTTFDNSAATADGPIASCDPYSSTGNMQNDVWFTYTPPTGCWLNLTIDCHSYDGILVIWSGSCGSLSEVDCDDSPNPSNYQFYAQGGTQYYFQIGDTGTIAGGGYTSFDMHCTAGPEPTASPTPSQTPTPEPTGTPEPFCSLGTSYSSAPGVAIPDDGCSSPVEDTIYVPTSGTVQKVTVRINISHTYTGDIDCFIEGPDGTTVELTTDNGGAGDNYVDTVFDDDAADPITGGSAPFTGTYQPEGSLSDFIGKDQIGNWTLRVCDDDNYITGTLDSWDICIESATGPTPTPGAVPVTGPVGISILAILFGAILGLGALRRK